MSTESSVSAISSTQLTPICLTWREIAWRIVLWVPFCRTKMNLGWELQAGEVWLLLEGKGGLNFGGLFTVPHNPSSGEVSLFKKDLLDFVGFFCSVRWLALCRRNGCGSCRLCACSCPQAGSQCATLMWDLKERALLFFSKMMAHVFNREKESKINPLFSVQDDLIMWK